MFKRVVWMGTGMAVGAGSAFWAKRKVERTVEQYLPEQVATRAAASARGIGQTVRAAAEEGRSAMRATEQELRARVEERTFVGERPTTAREQPVGLVDDVSAVEPEAVPRVRFDFPAYLAALTCFGLGVVTAAMMVIGNKPWDGRQIWAFNFTNGLHVGDLYAIGPIVVGLILAVWCIRRRRTTPKVVKPAS